MFPRTIIDKLQQWVKRPDRKPLVLRGARQVGKTVAVDMFSQSFDQYIDLNLELKADRELFESELPVEELYQAMLLRRQLSTERSTLLFIDEIQQSSAAVKMLRFFKEKLPHLPVIAAGSLLEVMLEKEDISFPVGRVDFLYMYPLTFEEFLSATDQVQLLEVYHRVPCPRYSLQSLVAAFHRYAMIGGLPEVVATYHRDQSVPALPRIYNALMQSYIDDVAKYAKGPVNSRTLRHCIETAPLEAGKRIVFANFGSSNYRSREVGEALRTLQRAMLVQLVYPAVSVKPPVMPDLKKHPKLQFLDTGLCNHLAGLHHYYLEQKALDSFYQGRMAEHIVIQERIARTLSPLRKTCFWTRESKNSNAEVDVILQVNDTVIPVEIKSGTRGRLRSLHLFMDSAVGADVAVRLSAAPFSREVVSTPSGKKFTLLNIPYFHTAKIEEYCAAV